MSRKAGVILGIGLSAGFFVLVPALAATLYVDKDNPCPGSGTTSAPYCSIQNAFNVVNPGDTIRIRDSTTPYDQRAMLNRGGTSGNPVIVEPDVGHNPIVRYSGSGASQGAFEIYKEYITIQGLTFDGAGINTSLNAIRITPNTAAHAQGIRILNNTIKNWGVPVSPGATIDTALVIGSGAPGIVTQGLLIQGNVFDSNRHHSIDQVFGLDTIIENNEFKNQRCSRGQTGETLAVNAVGIHIVDATGSNSGFNKRIVIRNNTFHDWAPHAACDVSHTPGAYDVYAGIWCDVWPADGVVEGNHIYNILQGDSTFGEWQSIGIHIEAACQNWTTKNNIVHHIGTFGYKQRSNNPPYPANKIYNNTIYSVGVYGLFVASGASDVKNNIVYNAGSTQMGYWDATLSSPHSINNNLYWDDAGGNKVGQWSSGVSNFSQWKTACNCDANSINANPQFVNATLGDFNLQSTSPAKGAGLGGIDMGAKPLTGGEELSAPANLRIIAP